MNGLVAYGSSDDEDDDNPQLEVFATRSHEPTDHNSTQPVLNEDHAHARNLISGDAAQMVGPQMPSGMTSEQYDEDSDADIPSMPERDLLRYLTQPSHPLSSMPPEPASVADPIVTARFQHFLELKRRGVHFNEGLAAKSSFKNPNLFASLLERAHLPPNAQHSSTLPTRAFDPSNLPSWAYKDQLLRSQQSIGAEFEITKKAESAAGQRTIDFTPASRDTQLSLSAKRKRP